MKRDHERSGDRTAASGSVGHERVGRQRGKRTEERVDEHGDHGMGPEDEIAERHDRRVTDRIMRSVGDGAVGPEPGVAVPSGDALGDES